jgi:predicted GTPase
MGYGAAQLRDLEATIAAVDCDVVVLGTPADFTRLVRIDRPTRQARYRSVDVGRPTLAEEIARRTDGWWP